MTSSTITVVCISSILLHYSLTAYYLFIFVTDSHQIFLSSFLNIVVDSHVYSIQFKQYANVFYYNLIVYTIARRRQCRIRKNRLSRPSGSLVIGITTKILFSQLIFLFMQIFTLLIRIGSSNINLLSFIICHSQKSQIICFQYKTI